MGINLFFVIVPQDVKKKNKFELFSFDIVFSFNVTAIMFLYLFCLHIFIHRIPLVTAISTSISLCHCHFI